MDRFSEFMRRIVSSAEHLADSWGAPGLAAIAFFDSSFITLPEVADLLVVMFTIRDPDQWYYFAAMTTLGSVAGCYALYLVGRKGGEALVRRGFHERHIDRGLAWFARHGALVLIIPALMPPPMPFKLFVLVAGMSGIRSIPFIGAVLFGRGLRYGGEAWLARTYGEETIRYIQSHTMPFFWSSLALLVAVGLLWWWWDRRHPPARDTAGQD